MVLYIRSMLEEELFSSPNYFFPFSFDSPDSAGWLIMKNWRPLSLTQIASSERETVGGVLGELTTVATLRIYIRKSVDYPHTCDRIRKCTLPTGIY